MRLSSLAQGALLGLGLATLSKAHMTTGVAHHHDERTLNLLCGVLGNLLGGCAKNYVSQTWQCSGSGTDGYSLDYSGKSCPSTYPSGWLWFGTNVGWAPPLGWNVPSTTWTPPSTFATGCSKAKWWAPSSEWIYPSSFLVLIPDFWAGLNWHSYQGPAQGWQCDGKSGTDGWYFDYNGKGLPSGLPAGFRFFGSNFGSSGGWAPPTGWTVPSDSWVAPSASLPYFKLWTCPSYSWKYPSIDIPCWWQTTDNEPSGTCGDSSAPSTPSTPDAPAAGWQCDGTGLDGKAVDYEGKPCPYGDADGFLFFGDAFGSWQPPYGWSVPSNDWTGPAEWLPLLDSATWWAPSYSWTYPDVAIPCWWQTTDDSPDGTCDATTVPDTPSPGSLNPDAEWDCDGSGNDGSSTDLTGASCPYDGYAGLFKYFGKTHGWQPSKGYAPSNWNTWSAPTAWVPHCGLATWWVPSHDWVFPASLSIPSFWAGAGWYPYNWAPKDFICDGSGTDGFDYDHNGASCPYDGVPWKFFGSSAGWQPAKGWSVPSNTWSPPCAWKCSGATWWAPTSSWIYPSSLSIPPFWVNLGWSSYLWAPSNFVCSGKGDDGFLFDHLGHGLPSGYPSGFKYFGIAKQWQPCNTFFVPSPTWSPPGSWSPKGATWWKPTSPWKVPSGYGCPNWWPSNLLLGIFSWL